MRAPPRCGPSHPSPLSRLALAASLLLAALACWVPDLPWIDGKGCDDAHACVRGVCLANQCVLTPPGKDASVTPVLVTRSITHFVDGAQVTVQDVPADLAMLVETSGGGFVTLPAAVADGGLIVFWDAPPPGQPYLLRLGSRYFASDAGVVDLSERALGRTDLEAPSPGTTLRTQLNCLVPWDVQDQIQLTTAGAGIGGLDLSTLPGWVSPPSGSGGLSATTSWSTAATPGLISTTQGDRPVYVQLERQGFNRGLADGGQVSVTYWHGRRVYDQFTLDMVSGAETVVPSSCIGDLKSNGSTQITVRGRAFGALLPATGSGATVSGVTATVRQAAWPGGPGPDLYRATWASAEEVPLSVQVPETSPYPAGWGAEASAVMTALVPVGLQQRDAGATTAFEKAVIATRRAWPLPTAELTPALGPPAAVFVNGEDVSAGAVGVGVQPEVTWTEPALGTPVAYEVSVWREQDPSRQKAPRLEGTLLTDVPRLRIPPGLLVPQSTYVLHVRAISAPLDPLRAPLLSGLPSDEAETVTGLIEP